MKAEADAKEAKKAAAAQKKAAKHSIAWHGMA
jgi:hypothetical protein